MARKAKKIVVLGGGISGYGSAILAHQKGFDTFLSDAGTIMPLYRERLEEAGVPYEQGGHTIERILAADCVVKSPGIPDTVPIVKALREQGTPIISEMEFAYPYLGNARTICITGSNGKTTTTSLIYKILCDAGYSVALGGNIGESFAHSVAKGGYDWYVLELSSFQLDGMFRFRADIAVLMNVTPDHLDRYDYQFDNYLRSKMRITQNQRTTDAFIFSADDKEIERGMEMTPVRARLLPFMAHSAMASAAGDAFADGDGQLTVRVGNRSLTIDANRMKIKGLHNTYNAMAAALAALAADVEPSVIEQSIYDFSPIEHRLEPAGVIDGVEYINDSKATNVDSVWYALGAMTRRTIWIAGGTDKGNNYEVLKPLVREKVAALVCMGVDNSKLLAAFGDTVEQIVSTSSLDEAMEAARRLAKEGDTVLLSPACASFDLFKNYEQRGTLFKEWVRRETEKEGAK